MTIKLSSLLKGLVGHWSLDKESLQSATVFADKTPNENVGTSANTPVFTTDRMGQADRAMVFNGVSDYIDCGNDASLDFGIGDLSISFWVKHPHTTGSKYIIRRGTIGRLVIQIMSGKIWINSYFGAGFDYWLVGGYIKDDAWSYVTVTFDRVGSQMLYIDGIYSNSRNMSGSAGIPWSASTSIIIAKYSTIHFNGLINEVRFYNRVLSQAERTALYEEYRPKISFGPLQKGQP